MYDLTTTELKILRGLNTPTKIQDFLNTMPFNFEENGETCMSPRRVLRERKAHCMEGAMLAALALRLAGRPPLVMDLRAVMHDTDHIVTVFEEHGCFGATSATNHGVLRYREPIYRTTRELAMSYFHEYITKDGEKTMRSYSRLIDLSRFDPLQWMTTEAELWSVPKAIDDARHYDILTRKQERQLRRADDIECLTTEIVQWKAPRKKLRPQT